MAMVISAWRSSWPWFQRRNTSNITRPTIAATAAPTSKGTIHDNMSTSSGAMLRSLPTIRSWSSMAMYAASRNSAPWAMLTVRISPKISVNPEATMKYKPAAVSPSRRVTTNSPGSLTADPAGVSWANKRTQASTRTIGMAPMTVHAVGRCRVAATASR